MCVTLGSVPLGFDVIVGSRRQLDRMLGSVCAKCREAYKKFRKEYAVEMASSIDHASRGHSCARMERTKTCLRCLQTRLVLDALHAHYYYRLACATDWQAASVRAEWALIAMREVSHAVSDTCFEHPQWRPGKDFKPAHKIRFPEFSDSPVEFDYWLSEIMPLYLRVTTHGWEREPAKKAKAEDVKGRVDAKLYPKFATLSLCQ